MSSGSDRRDGALIKGLLNMAWLHALQSAPPPRTRKDFLGSVVLPGSHTSCLQAQAKARLPHCTESLMLSFSGLALGNPVSNFSWVHLTQDCGVTASQGTGTQGCYWSDGGSAVPRQVRFLLLNSGSTGLFFSGLQVGFRYFQRGPSQ